MLHEIIIDGVEYIAIKKRDFSLGLPSNKIVTILRMEDNGVETLGNLKAFNNREEVFSCKTLELPWRNNAVGESCVPPGTYNVVPYASPSKGSVYLLQDVPNRSYIEIHAGNYYTQIAGCILVGREFSYINSDGQLDVTSSRDTLQELMSVFNYSAFTLIII